MAPDTVPPTTFIRAYYNRPGGSEVWCNPRASRPQQPSSSSRVNTPPSGGNASGPAVTEAPPPGATSKASQPSAPADARPPYEWISQGRMPRDVSAVRWEAWNNRPELERHEA